MVVFCEMLFLFRTWFVFQIIKINLQTSLGNVHFWMTCRICILAGDISPIDVLTHIPIVCEDHQIPYIYVPSKEVGAVWVGKRVLSVAMMSSPLRLDAMWPVLTSPQGAPYFAHLVVSFLYRGWLACPRRHMIGFAWQVHLYCTRD